MFLGVLQESGGELPHVVIFEASAEDAGIRGAQGSFDLAPGVLGVIVGAHPIDLALEHVGVARASVQQQHLDDDLLDVGQKIKDVHGKIRLCSGLAGRVPPRANEIGLDSEHAGSVGMDRGDQDVADGQFEIGSTLSLGDKMLQDGLDGGWF